MWKLMENIIEVEDKSNLISFLESSDRFTNGPKVQEFENVWSNWLGTSNSVMVNSGASANYLSIALVKELFGKGEVIVPSLGWSSDVSSIIQLGLTPVFVDINKKTLGINFDSLKQAVNENTKAIVVVHALGFNALTDEIMQFLKARGIFVIEDCCEAHGAVISANSADQKVGTFGDLSLFSFYYGHHITTIEGGMVCCSDQDHYQLLRMFRSHGMTREASQEVSAAYEKDYPSLNPLFTFALPGFNFRSTELNAVLGLGQMRKLDSNIQIRKNNLGRWLKKLDSNKYFTDFAVEGNSNFALPLVLNESNKNRLDKVQSLLRKMEVEFRLGTAGGGNLSRQPFVKKSIHKIADNQTNVDFIHDFGLYVGNGEHVDFEKIDVVTEKLNRVE
jgi:CDP-6-deoxy-D-xylo-4-hexulose-3-dehydrase